MCDDDDDGDNHDHDDDGADTDDDGDGDGDSTKNDGETPCAKADGLVGLLMSSDDYADDVAEHDNVAAKDDDNND